MQFVRALRRLWRHRLFRRLLAVRVAAQSSDGLLQVALASFVLFSPQRQPGAASIATVLAITLLPFSIVGPFVSVLLDRWSRRQVLLVVDICRAVLVLCLAALALTGVGMSGLMVVFYGGVLLAMSLNRFVLAALSSALPHTIDADEYLVANSVVPTVGPAGALVGAGIGATGRLVLGGLVPANIADACLFGLAGCGFVVSAVLSARIGRNQLGPDDAEPAHPKDVVLGLVGALCHLRSRSPAALGLLTIGAHRIIFGIVTVAMILVYRLSFHSLDQVDAALGDLALYGGITGAGFVVASILTPPVAQRIGVRAMMIIALVAAGVFQAVPGAILQRVPILIGGFLLGLAAQCMKICVDTLVQAYVGDEFKGRVFVLYDMIFNVAFVIAALIGAFILPADGRSVPILVVLAVLYLVVALFFAFASGRIGTAAFNRGRSIGEPDDAGISRPGTS